MERLTRKALHEFKLVEGVSKVAVALSGGKDSLALLHLLRAISGRGFPPFEIVAIHVGGAFSCGASVAPSLLVEHCEALKIPLILRESKQKREELECYSCSRERRRLIFEAAKEAGAETIAFGHHRDDCIETLLLNVLHKAELAALLPKVPMHDYGVTIIRPLIFVSEEQIKAFARESGFLRITCQCPVGQVSMRRKVKDFLTEIEAPFPNARDNLFQVAMRDGSKKALKN